MSLTSVLISKNAEECHSLKELAGLWVSQHSMNKRSRGKAHQQGVLRVRHEFNGAAQMTSRCFKAGFPDWQNSQTIQRQVRGPMNSYGLTLQGSYLYFWAPEGGLCQRSLVFYLGSSPKGPRLLKLSALAHTSPPICANSYLNLTKYTISKVAQPFN